MNLDNALRGELLQLAVDYSMDAPRPPTSLQG